jgi:cell division protein FtsB
MAQFLLITEERCMSKKIVSLLFIFILLALLSITVFGQRGLLHMTRLKEELKRFEVSNQKLQEENTALKKEIEQLKNDRRHLEDLARDELGLAKENELIYDLKKKHK